MSSKHKLCKLDWKQKYHKYVILENVTCGLMNIIRLEIFSKYKDFNLTHKFSMDDVVDKLYKYSISNPMSWSFKS